MAITAQKVASMGPLALQLKDYYLTDRPFQPYLPSTWQSRENDIIFTASCDLIARSYAARNELPALALTFGPPQSRENWAQALFKNNLLILWTVGNSLPNGIAKVLRSRVATVDDVTAKKGTNYDMVWPETRVALLKAIENGFTPTSWNPILIPAIQEAEAVLPEISATTTERAALSEMYKRGLMALRNREASQSQQQFMNNLLSIRVPEQGTMPASVLPDSPWHSASAALKPLKDWKAFAAIGGGLAVMVGLVAIAKKRRA